jgi:hypothetical protein
MSQCPNCRTQVLWSPCQRCGTVWQPARIEQTNIPGLYDIHMADGRLLTDIPELQVGKLIRELGLVPA